MFLHTRLILSHLYWSAWPHAEKFDGFINMDSVPFELKRKYCIQLIFVDLDPLLEIIPILTETIHFMRNKRKNIGVCGSKQHSCLLFCSYLVEFMRCPVTQAVQTMRAHGFEMSKNHLLILYQYEEKIRLNNPFVNTFCWNKWNAFYQSISNVTQTVLWA